MRNGIELELIGVIVREIERDLQSESPNGIDEPSFEQISNLDVVYREYDCALQNRPDYRLWRLYLKPHFVYRRPWLHDIQVAEFVSGDESLLQLLSACVESDNPVVQWSMVALAPDIIQQYASHAGSISDTNLFELMVRLDRRLRYDFVLLDRCPKSCGMATFFFLMSYQNARYKNGSRLTPRECREFLDSAINALKQAAPRWMPGLKPDTSELEVERRGSGRLIPGHDAFEHSRLSNVLSEIPSRISSAVADSTALEWSALVERLLSDRHDLSVSGWLLARSVRISEILHQRSRGFFETERSKKKRRKSLKKEMELLLLAGYTARDAGHYLEAAKFVYLWLRTIPDEFMMEDWIQEEIEGQNRRYGIFHYVGQGGLRKDERFARDDNQPLMESRTRGRQISWNTSCEDARVASEIFYPDKDEYRGGLVSHMAADMRNLPSWKVILSNVSARGQSHWGYLLTIEKNLADAGMDAEPDVLSSAFFLALHYGHVRSAGKIFARAVRGKEFVVTPDHVIEFVHSVRKATQLDPFGMRLDYLKFWQQLIIESCQLVFDSYGAAALPVSEILWLHEIILNRTITLYGSFSQEDASRLYQSNSGLISPQNLRNFYEEAFDFNRRTPGVANVDTVAQHLSTVFEVSGRKSVALSVVRFGEYLSFLAVGRDGKPVSKVEIGAPSDADVMAILSGASLWFEYPDIAVEDQIFWTPSMARLAKTAIRLAREIEAGVDTIFFAGEPWLMQLPLQHLFYAKEEADILVCLAPNFSSLSLRRDASGEPGIADFHSTDDDPEMKSLVQNISNLTVEHGEYLCKSVVAIVGHGTCGTEGGLPRVSLGKGREIVTANDWLGHLRGDAVLIHSCHLANTEPTHIGDIGGAVGLAFAVGCRTFVGPVTEVFAETAEFLHRKLISCVGGMGEGYMEALRGNGEVSLYSFYGDPCLALRLE